MTITAPQSWTFPNCPQPPEWQLDFPSLVQRFGWLQEMEACQQDPQWHAEGNVLIHVGMVCAELVKSDAWRALPPTERNIVFAAALLHDVAKPDVTREEDGRIRSQGHALKGALRTRRILADLDTPFAIRESIVGLVRYHGLPAYLLDRPDPIRSIIRASMTARLDLVATLALADARGRICQGRDDAPDRIAMFTELAAENSCLNTPYTFFNDHSRVIYFRNEQSLPTHQWHNTTQFEVTLMSGLPASGKDTWTRNHWPDSPIISLDRLREQMNVAPGDDQSTIIAAAKELAKINLRQKQPFLWNATSTNRMLREGLISLFLDYGARTRIVYCETSLQSLIQRNARRNRPVPDSVIEKLRAHLEVPDLTESHRVEYILT